MTPTSRLSGLLHLLVRIAATCLLVATLLLAGVYVYGGTSLLNDLIWDGSACG